MNELNPADLLVAVMNRIYDAGMTTTSGGNLSVIDDDGDIWITPTGLDKGSLRREDICCVKPDGTIVGPKPSVELPFHASVYRSRPDIRAVIHAHPPALVAFSVARKMPETRLVAEFYRTIGDVCMADYAAPGSEALSESIRNRFEEGYETIILENHGVCLGAQDMHTAFLRFETLELSAAMELEARRLGTPQPLEGYVPPMELPEVIEAGDGEEALRGELVRIIKRCCRHRLMSSANGVFSARLNDGTFLITPYGKDLEHIEAGDIVRARGGLHGRIYDGNEGVNAVAEASPTNVMAFAVTGEELEPRTIPESYIQLRDMKRIPFGGDAAGVISLKSPVAIVDNDCVVVTGATILSAFDRLEVTEATARSIISAREAGKLVNMTAAEIDEIDEVFGL